MSLRKVLLFTLVFFFTIITSLYAFEIEGIHLLKNNALSFKVGPHIYGDNDYMNFWKIDENNCTSAAGEIAYERKVSQKIAIELSLGFFGSGEGHKDVLFTGDSLDLTIKNLYLSPTAKYVFPINSSFVFYVGIGPDYYRTRKYHFYRFGFINYEISETFNTFGLHGLIGIEYYFYKQPVKHGFYDFPVSLIFEYKYSWIEIDDADKVLLDKVNTSFGTTYSYSDLDVGGHQIFFGVRYHF